MSKSTSSNLLSVLCAVSSNERNLSPDRQESNINKKNLFLQKEEVCRKIELEEKKLTDEELNFTMGLSSRNAEKAPEINAKFDIISKLYYEKAEINYHLDEFNEALQDLNKSIDLGLHNSNVFYLISKILSEQEQYKQATTNYHYASEIKLLEKSALELANATEQESQNATVTSELSQKSTKINEEPANKRTKNTSFVKPHNNIPIFTKDQKKLLDSIEDEETYRKTYKATMQSNLNAQNEETDNKLTKHTDASFITPTELYRGSKDTTQTPKDAQKTTPTKVELTEQANFAKPHNNDTIFTEEQKEVLDTIEDKETYNEIYTDFKRENLNSQNEEPAHKRAKHSGANFAKPHNNDTIFTEEQKELLDTIEDKETYHEIYKEFKQANLNANYSNGSTSHDINSSISNNDICEEESNINTPHNVNNLMGNQNDIDM